MSTTALRALRNRLDQHQRAATGRTLPVHDALRGLLPDGLKRGSTIMVEGSMSLALAVLAGPSSAGSWGAIVGVPEVGVLAASELGVDLDRLVLIPRPSDGWSTVVAALADAIDVIVARPPGQVAGNHARRLAARVRQRGAVLLSLGEWEGAELRLTATDQQWHGLGDGCGRLRARSMTVRVNGRGSAAIPREERIWLPGDESLVPSRPTLQVV